MKTYKRGENLLSFSWKYSDWVRLPRANPYLLRRRVKQMANDVGINSQF